MQIQLELELELPLIPQEKEELEKENYYVVEERDIKREINFEVDYNK